MPTPYDEPVDNQAGSCPTCGQPIAPTEPQAAPLDEPEQDYTICEFCGEDLPHHMCRPEE